MSEEQESVLSYLRGWRKNSQMRPGGETEYIVGTISDLEWTFEELHPNGILKLV